MIWLLLTLLFLQGFLMFIDEGIYHRRRGLPKWERIGHPLDTLSYLGCLFFLKLPPSTEYLKIYLGLALFSSVLITKDEFIHHRLCASNEQWLHSLLFVLHPIILLGFAWGWYMQVPDCDKILFFTTMLGSMFLIYQTVYWNFVWKPIEQKN